MARADFAAAVDLVAGEPLGGCDRDPEERAPSDTALKSETLLEKSGAQRVEASPSKAGGERKSPEV